MSQPAREVARQLVAWYDDLATEYARQVVSGELRLDNLNDIQLHQLKETFGLKWSASLTELEDAIYRYSEAPPEPPNFQLAARIGEYLEGRRGDYSQLYQDVIEGDLEPLPGHLSVQQLEDVLTFLRFPVPRVRRSRRNERQYRQQLAGAIRYRITNLTTPPTEESTLEYPPSPLDWLPPEDDGLLTNEELGLYLPEN